MYSISYTCSGAEVYALYNADRGTSLSRIHQLSTSRAKRLLEKNVINVVIDVRTDTEWANGHHTNAKHIPYNSVTETCLKRFDIKKDDSVLIYCNTGHRAKHAAELLKSFGIKNVFYISSSYEVIELNPCRIPSLVKCASPLTPVTTV
jgi:phage shock protein E